MNPGKKKVNRQLNKNPIYFEKELCYFTRCIYVKYIVRTICPRVNIFCNCNLEVKTKYLNLFINLTNLVGEGRDWQ